MTERCHARLPDQWRVIGWNWVRREADVTHSVKCQQSLLFARRQELRSEF